MTERPERIMNRMREAERRRILARLKDQNHRNRLVGDINLVDQDETSRVGGGDQEMKVLKAMNELEQVQNENWAKDPSEVDIG